MRKRHWLVVSCLLAIVGWLSSLQASPPKSVSPAPANAPAGQTPEDAVRRAIKAYVEALNAGDFKSVATFWTADGDYADPGGRVFKARKVIEEELVKRFGAANHPKLAVDIASVRLVSPDVAVEDGAAELTPAEGGPPARGAYTAVWVKQQGKWLISSLRESMPARAAHHERLAALEWLVGHWKGEADGTTVHVATEWTPEKTYLIREIEIDRGDQRIRTASQRIGWDPLTRRIKAWTFDVDGGHAESFWSKVGNDWLAQSSGVARDGRITTARNRYREIGDGEFTLESIEAQVAGESRPDFKIHFTRQATEE